VLIGLGVVVLLAVFPQIVLFLPELMVTQ